MTQTYPPPGPAGPRELSPLECILMKFAFVTPVECVLANSLDLKRFRIRTYKNRVGGGGAKTW